MTSDRRRMGNRFHMHFRSDDCYGICIANSEAALSLVQALQCWRHAGIQSPSQKITIAGLPSVGNRKELLLKPKKESLNPEKLAGLAAPQAARPGLPALCRFR